MKRTIFFSLLILLILTLAGCSSGADTPSTETPQSGAVYFSEHEITLNIGGNERAGTYSGYMENDLPNEGGKFTTTNSEGYTWTYTGYWVDGHMEGTGETVWSDGTRHVGNYSNDAPNGFGIFYQDDILLYEGNFQDGQPHGDGISYDILGNVVFKGNFVQGEPEE